MSDHERILDVLPTSAEEPDHTWCPTARLSLRAGGTSADYCQQSLLKAAAAMTDVHIVVIDYTEPPEYWAFEEHHDAQHYADVRGNVADLFSLPLVDPHTARLLIRAEAKERADEARVDRYMEEH